MAKFNFKDLENALKELNTRGEFKASIITTESGFLIASAINTNVEEDVIAATGPAIYSTVNHVNGEIKLGAPHDIIIMAENGVLVIKLLEVKKDAAYILAIIAPPNANWMEKNVSNVITKIKDILSTIGFE